MIQQNYLLKKEILSKQKKFEQIKLSNTKTEGNTGAKPENNETKGENGSSLIKFNGEYLVFLLALVLFI